MFEGHLKVLQLFTGEPLNDGSVCRAENVQRWLLTTTGWSFRALKDLRSVNYKRTCGNLGNAFEHLDTVEHQQMTTGSLFNTFHQQPLYGNVGKPGIQTS